MTPIFLLTYLQMFPRQIITQRIISIWTLNLKIGCFSEVLDYPINCFSHQLLVWGGKVGISTEREISELRRSDSVLGETKQGQHWKVERISFSRVKLCPHLPNSTNQLSLCQIPSVSRFL